MKNITVNDLADSAIPMHAAEQLLDKHPHKAQQLIHKTILQMPELGAAYFNVGLALHQQGRLSAAIRAYQTALTCNSHYNTDDFVTQSAKRNLAQDLLLNGCFDEGWNLYEERLDRKNYRFFEELHGEAWKGACDERPLSRLILVAEQGLGDTLMFFRLALELQKNLDTPVSLFCQQPLVNLLRKGSELDTVTATLNNKSSPDPKVRWCPLMSLPQRMKIQPTAMAQQSAYLALDQKAIERWRIKLRRRIDRRLIALHWQGNPRHEGSLYSRGRSMPFSSLKPLASLENVEFVSIQKGAGSEQLKLDAGLPFVQGQNCVSASMDFIDTAAVIANCDLLISADSGVVHLAGALGLPAWVALRHVPEWRWGLHSERTPWYPSLRLFRQPSHGDWASVITAMIRTWRREAQQ